ncbi:MAG: hypothetical protein NT169_17240 [Chloroflexi bacterium]|nr:hypothetical protein [Chloroflexota bacterium]
MERRNIRPGTRVLRVVRDLLLTLILLVSMGTASTGISSPPSSPNGQIRTPGSGQASGAGSPAGLPGRATPTLPAASVRRGAQPFVTVLCRFPDVPGEPESPAFFERLFSDTYPGLNHYWRTVSYGAISLDGSSVVGWYVLPHDSDAYRTGLRDKTTPASVITADLQRLAEDCTAAVNVPINWEQIYGINLVFNASLDRPLGGRVCLIIMGMDKCYGATWIWAANAGNQAIWAHEMGHSFGLLHSSSDLGATYNNVWDVMSYSGAYGFDPEYRQIAQDPLAFAKESLGWIPADRKFVAAPDSEATITLERLAAPGPDGYLLAEIPIPGEDFQARGAAARFYTVEARRQVDYDGNLPGEAVVIHEVDRGRATPARAVSMKLAGDDGGNGASTSSAMWTPGSSFRDFEHGIAVTVERATSSGFVVTITTRRLPWPLTPYDHSIAPAGEIAFAWQPVPDAAGYQLEITPEAGQEAATPAIETAASAGYRALLAPGIYRWRVRSLSAEGAQPWTTPWEVTVGRLQPAAGVEAAALDAEPAAAHGHVSTAVDGHGDAYALWAGSVTSSQVSAEPELMGGVAADVFFAYRPAGGAWGPPIKINDDPAIFHSYPSIATDGAGNAYAIWIASSNPGFEADVYFAYRPHAAAAGAESGWSDSVRVNGPGLVAAVSPALAVNPQGDAYAAWIDVRTGHAAVYFAERLHDIGATAGGVAGEWSANTLISDDPQTAFFPPSLAADARGNVYLAWQQECRCNRFDLIFAGRPAGGAWGAAAPIVPNPTGLMLNWPSLVVDANDTLYAVWQDDRGAIVELYAARCGPNCGLPVAGASAWGNAIWLGRDADPRSAPAAHVKVDERGNACVSWPDTTGLAGCLEFPLANASQ